MSASVIDEQGIQPILLALSKPLPEKFIKQRVGWRDSNGEEQWVNYIDWHTAAGILDEVYPEWSHEVRDVMVIGDLVAVTAAITIRGVTRCGVGVDTALDEKGIKAAEHDALKRAAIKFGLARSLYSSGKANRKAQSSSAANQSGAKSDEKVSDKQLAAIYAIAKAKSLDAQLESFALFKCEPEKLSRSAASDLIDHLRNIRISA
jgi:hypothetical protein